MGNRNYDDWNDEFELNRSSSSGSSYLSSRVSAFALAAGTAVLIVINLVNAYSLGCVSYTSDLYFDIFPLLKEFAYVIAGIVACIVAFAIPEKAFKILSPALVLGCCLASVLDIIFPIGLLVKNWFIMLLFYTGLFYCSAYFSNRFNTVNGISDITIPCAVSVVNIVILSSTGNATYVVFYMLMTLLIFLVGGVGVAGVALLVLFCIVPSVLFVLVSPSRLRLFVEFLVPGLSSGASESVLSIAKSAIESGRLTGKGIGLGSYKYVLSGYENIVPFCSYAEETGFAGVFVLFLIVALVVVSGFAAARHTESSDFFLSNLCIGLSSIISFRFILHLSYLIGLLPFGGVTCPFITPGGDIIFMFFAVGIFLRAIAFNPLAGDSGDGVPMSSFGDEYYFEESENESRKS